ncbi:MAG: hypothetical protein R2912_07870 [Eubacteriales bacterium]
MRRRAAKSEPRCPLCGTEVLNPNELHEEKPIRPYPAHVEHLDKTVDRRYIASFISLLLLIPLFTTMLVNILVSKQLTWSYLVIGGRAGRVYRVSLPMIARMPKVLYMVIDTVAVCVLLLLIRILTQSKWDWLLLLGLPLITVLTALMCWFFSLMASSCRIPVLIRFSFGLTCIGLLVVAIEFFIGLYKQAIAWPTWSPLRAVALPVLSSSLLILTAERG